MTHPFPWNTCMTNINELCNSFTQEREVQANLNSEALYERKNVTSIQYSTCNRKGHSAP